MQANVYICFVLLPQWGEGRVYRVFPVQGMYRGLYDWSDGRDALAEIGEQRLSGNARLIDVFAVNLTWEEADDINDGIAKPPDRIARLKAIGQDVLI